MINVMVAVSMCHPPKFPQWRHALLLSARTLTFKEWHILYQLRLTF